MLASIDQSEIYHFYTCCTRRLEPTSDQSSKFVSILQTETTTNSVSTQLPKNTITTLRICDAKERGKTLIEYGTAVVPGEYNATAPWGKLRMPALSEEEMASILDPALQQPSVNDDEEALRAQLFANIQQNKIAQTANSAIAPVNAATASGAVDATRTTSEAEEDEAKEHNETSHVVVEMEVNGDGTPEEDVMATTEGVEEQEDAMVLDEPQDAGITAKTTPGTGEESGEDVEIEDEEYEDANSNLGDMAVDTAQADSSEIASAIDLDERSEASEESDSDEETDGEVDLCMFCDKKEPDETPTEEDLACAVCRRPAHSACARLQDPSITDTDHWRCPDCEAKQTSTSPKGTSSKPRHSAPRLVRDLLPVSRGLQKPGAHSIFAQPLIQDDEGGRSLRKRRSDPDEREARADKKRKKPKETPKKEPMEIEPISHSTRRSSQKLVPGVAPPVEEVKKTARILQHRPYHKAPPHKLILAFRLEQEKIAAILAQPSKPHRRKYHQKKQKIPAPPPYQPPVPKFPALPTHHLIFPSMFGDREGDINAKPYGGILSEADAETSRSLPQMRDRDMFEAARKEAEEERKNTSAKAEAEIYGPPNEGANATNSKRTVSGPPTKIKCVQFGKHVIDTSYAAPYPEEYSHESRLFICEFCLKYLPSEFVAWRHKLKCFAKHPPGDEIYREGSISVWEVDGRKKTEYCQCLCLMAKLFLGSKTLYYDVDPFLFYILTEYDEFGYHFVGYFSKEKRPASQNNVSCILVLPIHQRKGYATFLIEFSYLLTRLEGKEGSPEKPLSDMGLTAYRSYWDLTISKHLLELGSKSFSVKDIMLRTGMTADDVVHSLERLYALVKDPVTKIYAIRYNKDLYEETVNKYESKNFRKIQPERLVWTPYIMGRSDGAALDAQPVKAIAQRQEDIIEAQAVKDAEKISPKTSEQPLQSSPLKNMIDPALLSDNGNVAPGPPSTDAMVGVQATTANTAEHAAIEEPLTNGDTHLDKGKAPASTTSQPALTGYALTYATESIPANRFQIDPPIPPAMLRLAKKRKSTTGASGTPRPNGTLRSPKKPTTPQGPVRSSPRKAGSVNGSGSVTRTSSRASTPDTTGKAPGSIRRSGRRSGLANEITTSTGGESDGEEEVSDSQADNDDVELEDVAASDEEEESEDEDEEDEIEVAVKKPRPTQAGKHAELDDEERSDRSESSSGEEEDEEVIEESDASDDPDAEVDEEEEDESGEEEEAGQDAAISIPSAVSSAAVSDDEEQGEEVEAGSGTESSDTEG